MNTRWSISRFLPTTWQSQDDTTPQPPPTTNTPTDPPHNAQMNTSTRPHDRPQYAAHTASTRARGPRAARAADQAHTTAEQTSQRNRASLQATTHAPTTGGPDNSSSSYVAPDPLPLSHFSTPSVPNSLWCGVDFMLGAGMVVIQPSTGKVVVLSDERRDRRGRTYTTYFLPKGRKDVGESLEQTALREAYEEVCGLEFRVPISKHHDSLQNIPVMCRRPHTDFCATLYSLACV